MMNVLTRPILRHPVYIWLLWASGVTLLACFPALLSDPALWFYLVDPELVALFIVVGLQYTGLELGALWLAVRARVRPRPRPRRPADRPSWR